MTLLRRYRTFSQSLSPKEGTLLLPGNRTVRPALCTLCMTRSFCSLAINANTDDVGFCSRLESTPERFFAN
jgi:hypothetical protein